MSTPNDQLRGRYDAVTPPHSMVVYTAITGNYDTLKEQPYFGANEAEFVAFVDRPNESRTWHSRPIHRGFGDPGRNAKIHKILPHVYFPDARYSLWIDGSVTIRFSFSLQQLVDRYLADCDLAVFQHGSRTCVYQEASVCLLRRLDDAATIWNQISRYTREAYPPNAGLAECTVVLRRHTPTVNMFNEAWWDEVERGSKRDQLSFPYVVRKLGLRYQTFPGSILGNALFRRDQHAVSMESRPSRGAARIRSHRSWLKAAIRSAVVLLRPRTRRRTGVLPIWLQAPTVPVPVPDEDTVALSPLRHASTALPARKRRTIAFGPARDLPSWNWVGFDTARELSKYYDVEIYDSWSSVPDCDVLFVIKERPPNHFVHDAQRKRTKLVYCPIDVYQDHDQLVRDGDFLRACAMVVVHCERLMPPLRIHCGNTHFVDHHSRYALGAMADYKATGFLLWIGGCQYVPYLVRWLQHHPLDHEIKILTDIDNYQARHAGRVFAAEIGMRFGVYRGTTSIAGCEVYRWSERRQTEMMRGCKAALDIKMTAKFEQAHKPPTKAQQYIASGIPFAVNRDSYSAEYFRRRGFEVASPADTERWLSREYWEATRLYGEQLRAATSMEVVGARYRELIESL